MTFNMFFHKYFLRQVLKLASPCTDKVNVFLHTVRILINILLYRYLFHIWTDLLSQSKQWVRIYILKDIKRLDPDFVTIVGIAESQSKMHLFLKSKTIHQYKWAIDDVGYGKYPQLTPNEKPSFETSNSVLLPK